MPSGGVAYLLEPAARNTAPAILLARSASPTATAAHAIVLVMPADHLIGDAADSCARACAARALAAQGWLVTFGVPPTRPETGYGYIAAATRWRRRLPSRTLRREARPRHGRGLSGRADYTGGTPACSASAPQAIGSRAAARPAPSVLEAARACAPGEPAARCRRAVGFERGIVPRHPGNLDRLRGDGDGAPTRRGAGALRLERHRLVDTRWRSRPTPDAEATGSPARPCWSMPTIASCRPKRARWRWSAWRPRRDRDRRRRAGRRASARRTSSARSRRCAPRRIRAPNTTSPCSAPGAAYTVLEDAPDCKVKRLAVKPGEVLEPAVPPSAQRALDRGAWHRQGARGRRRERAGAATRATYIPIGMVHRLENPSERRPAPDRDAMWRLLR